MGIPIASGARISSHNYYTKSLLLPQKLGRCNWSFEGNFLMRELGVLK